LLEERFYIADTGNGRVLLVQLPADDPLPAWENMVARLSAGDLAGAIAYFSRLTAERYYKSFLALGLSEVAADINQIGVLTRVFVRNDEAEYWFEHVVESKILLFRVEFIKENGVWRIMEF
jgi:hypothetical protein